MQTIPSPSRYLLLAAALLALPAACAPASTISFTGDLRTDATFSSCGGSCALGPSDADVTYAQFAAVVRDFTITSASTVQAVTFSYGGGINGAGTTVAQSGFEPYLSLFDATGNFLSSTYFGTTCPAGAHVNSSLGGCDDVLLDAGTLAAGSYQIAISAFDNMSFAENYGSGTLADGFTGLGNLADGEDLHYAFDVTATSGSTAPPPSTVPEPSSLLLLGTGLLVLRHRLLARKVSREHRQVL